jgi:hypothetical protein
MVYHAHVTTYLSALINSEPVWLNLMNIILLQSTLLLYISLPALSNTNMQTSKI